MEEIQEQIMLLREQVGLLETMIRNLPAQIRETMLAQQGDPVRYPSTSHFQAENQGFLLDEDLSQHASQLHYDLPLEGQIQRLTAQLTAAYNRIAALEEQLLAQRLMQ